MALAARLVAWPLSDVVDSDAVTRALIAERYLERPQWVGDGVWPPLQFYLTAIFIQLCGDRVIGSVLLHVLLGSAIAFPVYAFTRRVADTAVAVGVTLLVVFDPLVFRNSLQGLAGVPFFFFAACAMNNVARAGSEHGRSGDRQALYAGSFITIAAGIRYEAWLLIAAMTAFLLFAKGWKRALLFWGPAMLFPVAWMLTGLVVHGNMFHGVDYAYYWNTEVAGSPAVVGPMQLLERTVFFPVSFLMVMSLPLVLLAFWGVGKTFRDRSALWKEWPWLLLFPLFLAIDVVKARNAGLLLQHRYTIVLVLLFIPYLILGLAALRRNWAVLLVAVVLSIWNIRFSLRVTRYPLEQWATEGTDLYKALSDIRIRTVDQMEAIPRLRDGISERLVTALESLRMEDPVLILDFFGWQQTYNAALHAPVRAGSIFFLGSDELTTPPDLDGLARYIHEQQGRPMIIVIRDDSHYADLVARSPDGRVELYLDGRSHGLVPHGRVDRLGLYTFEDHENGTWD